ncbi:MAG: translocation/assembly module TamB domain-containing protein [Alphaproteobacteria bacterium]|nr:translocation/assembly module TamB domain-containing protein [Alphaproteobacteria bacterium]MCW5738789.1 translocation/assembly module TamB domain-containing protein [Alphaproteobacteria bacterium]
MRVRRAIALTAIGLVSVAVVVFAGLQTRLGQRWLMGAVASMASSPDMRVAISGSHGYFPTNLTIDRIELADRRGVWLRIDQAHVDWAFTSLFSDRLRIDRLAARRVEMMRQPDAPGEPAPPSSGGGFSLPIGVDLKALAVDEIHVRAPAAPMDSRWKLAGNASVAADTGQSDVRLLLERTDGREGRLSIDGRYDIFRRVVAASVSLQEGESGLIASLVGRPDLKEVSARLVANGDERQGNAELTFEGGDAMSARGSLVWRPQGDVTAIALKLEAAAPGLPDGPLARIVRQPLRIDGQATISDALLDVRELTAVAAPIRLRATGKYGLKDRRIDGEITLAAAEAGGLRDLLAGTTWRDLGLDLRLSGTTAKPRLNARIRAAEINGPDGASARDADVTIDAEARDIGARMQATMTLSGHALDVTAPTVDGRGMPPTRVDFSAKTALQPDGRIVVDAAELASAFASLKGAGAYQPASRSGEARARLAIADAATISTLAGRPITGRGTVDVTVRMAQGQAGVEWRGILQNLSVEGVPTGVTTPDIRLSGAATAQPDQRWTLRALRIESDALAFEMSGQGRGQDGDIEASLAAARLAAIDRRFAGAVNARATVAMRPDGIAVKLSADAVDLVHETLRAGRLALSLDAQVRGEAVSGALNASGDLADQPLRIDARFARAADGTLTVPTIDARWASSTIDSKDLTVTASSATGSARARLGDLAEIGRVIGQKLAGSVELDVTTDNEVPGGRVKTVVRGKGLQGGGFEAAALDVDATLVDPLGRAGIEGSARATGLRGIDELSQVALTVGGERAALDVTVDARGPRTNAQLAAKLREFADGFVIELARATGRFADLPIALAGASKARIEGSRVVVEPTSLRIADGRVNVAGTLDSGQSDLGIEIAGFPLVAIGKIAPGVDMVGTLQAKARVRGALAAPRVESTFTIAAMRLRRPMTELLPALNVTGSAALSGNRATFDTQVAAGAASRLTIKGDASLAGGPTNAAIAGTLDLGPFAPLVGSTVQGLRGTATPDVSLRIAGDSITGQGNVTLRGIALTLPVAGLRLQGGDAVLRLNGNALAIERLVASTGGSGDINATGTVQLDAARGFPVDLQVTTRRAALVNRDDLVATISSNLRVTGAATNGLTVSGPVTIDRAELTIGASQVASYPTLPVREINKPGAIKQPPPPRPVRAGKPVPTGPPRGAAVNLALTIDAPRAVFVRGRGLDAEVGGRFQVSGDASKPGVVGNLSLRRGDFNLAGKRLRFTRGNVSLIDLETIEPLLDFVASAPINGGTAEIVISGTSRAPRIELRSSPEMPPDEVMATLLFGKSGSKLSPFELVSAAQALAELTGVSQGRGFLARIRGGLGLDRLAVDSANEDPASITLEAGRYVAPGIYVGAKQGATADSSRGVVEIDIMRNTKIEADVGADKSGRSTGRVGIKMEWDY